MNEKQDIATYLLRVDEVLNAIKGLGEKFKKILGCTESVEIISFEI